jgi:hypothetical protein
MYASAQLEKFFKVKENDAVEKFSEAENILMKILEAA